MRGALLPAALAAIAVTAPSPSAKPSEPQPLVRISGSSPLARSCEASTAQRSSEVEPSLAADPRDPDVLVAAWQQDRYHVGGGAAAVGVAHSRDGGATWRRARVPGLSTCASRKTRRSDPWLSYGPDGTVYLAAVRGTVTRARGLRTGIAVSASRDGGASWSRPVAVARPGARFNDKEAVTADPTRPGHAYVVWSQIDRILMSRTTDAGRTWSKPRAIARGDLLNISTISVLADGTLVHGFFRAGARTEQLVTSRSRDAGATWSRPVRVARVEDVTPYDRRAAIAVRSVPIAAPAVVAAPDGTAYASWVTRDRRGLARVMAARSTDGGRSWSSRRAVIGGRRHLFAPALAVDASGAVAVTAYRLLRRGRADVLAATSTDRGRRWRVRRLTAAFSLHRAPRAQGGERFLGDYTGLTATGDGFAAALALAPPIARRGPSDVFVVRLPPR